MYYTLKPNEIPFLSHCSSKSGCDLLKPTDNFHAGHRKKNNGKDYICKKCKKLRNRDYIERNRKRHVESSVRWMKNNPERVENNRLKMKYGITLEDKRRILDKQHHRCAICSRDDRELVV